ncbi:TolC family protein [Ottowia sp.]|uniref:TolC family protein n=1 Tax=Ottowia sp. TaxID=1898956 RepID=UPI002CC6DC3E|nr:TolC family protein [Ottowia sp.]HPZ58304.1 TolC family protein [Ottowia sp.]HQD49287.1 TolC family protein [Ottowia sp.]
MSTQDHRTGVERAFRGQPQPAAGKAPLRSALFMAAWLALHGGAAAAAGLPALISEAVHADPAILEARANEDVAGSRAAASRAQHYPTVGLQAGSYVANPNGLTQPFRGLVSRVNIYAAGSIDTAIERDELKQQSLKHKTAETREVVALNVAQLFLEALRAKELMEVERHNLARHEKIVGDLEVVVANDKGRRYELVQAQSRALQVRMRIVQYEKSMKLALSKLTRYTRQDATLDNPFAEDWRQSLRKRAANPH